MSIENQNPQNIDITDEASQYRQAVDDLSSAATSKIFEQGLKADNPGLPTLVETDNGRVFAISGKTDEHGPETTIDDIGKPKKIRYVISPDGLVWVSDGVDDDKPEKMTTLGIANLTNDLRSSHPAPEELVQVFHAVEAERARGLLPTGVLKAEAMEPSPGGTLSEEESLRISADNDKKGRIAAKIQALLDSIVSGGSTRH